MDQRRKKSKFYTTNRCAKIAILEVIQAFDFSLLILHEQWVDRAQSMARYIKWNFG